MESRGPGLFNLTGDLCDLGQSSSLIFETSMVAIKFSFGDYSDSSVLNLPAFICKDSSWKSKNLCLWNKQANNNKIKMQIPYVYLWWWFWWIPGTCCRYTSKAMSSRPVRGTVSEVKQNKQTDKKPHPQTKVDAIEKLQPKLILTPKCIHIRAHTYRPPHMCTYIHTPTNRQRRWILNILDYCGTATKKSTLLKYLQNNPATEATKYHNYPTIWNLVFSLYIYLSIKYALGSILGSKNAS